MVEYMPAEDNETCKDAYDTLLGGWGAGYITPYNIKLLMYYKFLTKI